MTIDRLIITLYIQKHSPFIVKLLLGNNLPFLFYLQQIAMSVPAIQADHWGL